MADLGRVSPALVVNKCGGGISSQPEPDFGGAVTDASAPVARYVSSNHHCGVFVASIPAPASMGVVL